MSPRRKFDATLITVDVHLAPETMHHALRNDAQAGLNAMPKDIPPKWFYDHYGSQLFDEITKVAEYYPTRCERSILMTQAATIAEVTKADTLIELGSGTSDKTTVLLDALRSEGTLRRFMPFDVSEQTLRAAAALISTNYPGTEVHAVVGDFEQHLHTLPVGGKRLIAFLGGTIGNLEPAKRATFLQDVANQLQLGDHFLLGTDLVKAPERLIAAYDDQAGITALFNKNLLSVLNRELDADFDHSDFTHVAAWVPERQWIEMRLEARRDLEVKVVALNQVVRFAQGEQMRTEISAKFRRDRVESELADAGLTMTHWWTDPDGDFAVSLSTPST